MEIVGPRSSEATRGIVEFARRNRLPAHLAATRAAPTNEAAVALIDGLVTTSCRSCGCPAARSCATRRPARSRARSASGSSSRRARRSTSSSSAAGPAGLGAAVYGASEGLDTLVVESSGARRPGGHVAPDRELPRLPRRHQRRRAHEPRGHAGAEVRRAHRDALPRGRARAGRRAPPRPARGRPRGRAHAPSSSPPAPTTAGCPSPTLDAYEGISVFYAAGPPEARQCGATRVGVVGGGNSAAQAAIWLARGGALVTLLHRRADLSETMSDYLIHDLDRYGVAVRDRSEIVELHGDATASSRR